MNIFVHFFNTIQIRNLEYLWDSNINGEYEAYTRSHWCDSNNIISNKINDIITEEALVLLLIVTEAMLVHLLHVIHWLYFHFIQWVNSVDNLLYVYNIIYIRTCVPYGRLPCNFLWQLSLNDWCSEKMQTNLCYSILKLNFTQGGKSCLSRKTFSFLQVNTDYKRRANFNLKRES